MTRIPVFRAGSQLVKVRFIMLLSLATLVGSTYAGVNLVQHFGQSLGDGGVLKPLPERIALGAFVFSLGAVFAGSMWLYGKFYVASIDFDSREQKLYLNTVEFFGTKRHAIELSNILDSSEHAGQLDLTAFDPSSISVNAPWKSVRLKGWKWSLIIDAQGKILHQELFEKLF
ncbi:MAG: hypothetical protein KME08_03130 [Aphanothece sp. CMT-3BRIN-NPC111]|jgi:hypothetical protein|nr:hypothetical protein [Aphanothece sp. CMT-3BRIN-NPC111]